MTAVGGEAGVFLSSENNGHVLEPSRFNPSLQLGDEIRLDLGCEHSPVIANRAGESLGPAAVAGTDVCNDLAGSQLEELDQEIVFVRRRACLLCREESERDEDRCRHHVRRMAYRLAPGRHDDQPCHSGLKIARKAAMAPISGITSTRGFASAGFR